MLQQPRSALAGTTWDRVTTVRCKPLSPILGFGQKAHFPVTPYTVHHHLPMQADALKARSVPARNDESSVASASVNQVLPASVQQEEKPMPGAAASSMMEPSLSASSYSGTSRQSSLDMDRMIRPKRKRINPEQLDVLLGLFAHTDTPSYELRDRIGAQLGMSNREVQVACEPL